MGAFARVLVTDTSNEWIGFWGGYLGSIIGGLITLYVLFRTLKDNKKNQIRQEKIDFCNYVSEAIGKLCGKINERDIYALRFINMEEFIGGNKDDIYKALLAENEASEIITTLSCQLIAKIDDINYINVEKLMDKVEELYDKQNGYELGFEYTNDEIKEIKDKCNTTRRRLGEIRDYVVEFIKLNTN